MAFLSHFCILFIFNLLHLQVTTSKHIICNTISCGDIDIKFPFGLKGSDQDHNCYYYPTPTFQLSCNNLSHTILTLPNSSGDLIIKRINYEDQTIQVNDPEGCLPKRFLLHNLNLSGSPFNFDPTIYGNYNLTFLRCPSNLTKSSPLAPISCLSDQRGNTNVNSSSSSVIVSWSRPIVSSPLSQTCEVISSAVVPLPKLDMPMWPFWPDLNADVGLVWTEPRCGNCAISGQVCGFSKDNSLQVRCSSGPQTKSQGLPRSAKYGLAIVPGLLCMIGLSCFVCCKLRVNTNRRRSTELATTISLEPIIPFVMGLDGATIENYPKTLLGESGRLLKPSDNTCSICLSEYKPKDTLRTIPDCNHYFHAHCIDEWLKMNGTCPLCRNSPQPSSTVTPSFSSLSPTSSLSSST